MIFTRRMCMMLVPIVIGLVSFYLFTKPSVAAYKEKTEILTVEIDGVNYGVFSKIEGLDEALSTTGSSGFSKISLERNFVAEPSLYLWAKSREVEHNVLGDITIIVKDSSGKELRRYVLKRCQPLSWTVEKSSPAVGGFYEIVDIAIQKIQLN